MPDDVGSRPALARRLLDDRARLVERRPGRHLREPSVGEPARAPVAPAAMRRRTRSGSGAAPAAARDRLRSPVRTRPSNVTDRSVHSRRSSSTCSSMRRRDSRSPCPSASYSTAFQPSPTPRRNRPSREQVDLGRLLGHERGLALRQDDDAGHQLERRDRGEVAEQHERLVERRVRRRTGRSSRVHRGVGAETWS